MAIHLLNPKNIHENQPSGRWQMYAGTVFFLLILLSGCAVTPPGSDPSHELPDSLAAKYRQQAIALEKKGELRQALLSWWIVQSYYPYDEEISEKIATLKKETQQRAAKHFSQAVSFYQNGALKNARREFLLTLAYDPEHSRAIIFLTEKLQDHVFKNYTVRQGDTPQKIAADTYNDPSKDFLITSFNSHISQGVIKSGSKLQLLILTPPVADTSKFTAPVTYNVLPVLEPRRLKKLVAASSVATTPAPAPAAKKTSDSELYQQARLLLDQEDYMAALLVLRTVDSQYSDVKKLIAYTEVFLQQEADAHYRKGISYYLSENLDMAIQEWEKVLRLQPHHLKAKKDLRNARRLQRKIKKL